MADNYNFGRDWPLITAAFCAALVLGHSSAASADQPTLRETNGVVIWQAGVDGVEIEIGEDQTVKRIYSRGLQEVTMPDRRGIRTATIIAEERAKANIVRFLQQNVATGRVVAEVEATLSRTKQERTDDNSAISRIDTRRVTESLTEITASYSEGVLRGVVVLEQGYNKERQEAWVVVGISEKTIRAADAVKKSLTNEKSKSSNGKKPTEAEGESKPEGQRDPLRQPSEVRRSKQDF